MKLFIISPIILVLFFFIIDLIQIKRYAYIFWLDMHKGFCPIIISQRI